MKKLIIKYSTLIAFSVSVFLLLSCSGGNLAYQTALRKNDRSFKDQPQLKAQAAFLASFKNFSLMSVKLSELAIQRAYAVDLVKFAKDTKEAHLDFNESLDRLARKEGVKMPQQVGKDFQNIYQNLSTEERDDMDRQMVSVFDDMQENILKQAEEFAINAKDGDVRAFTARALGMLRTHERQVEKLENTIR